MNKKRNNGLFLKYTCCYLICCLFIIGYLFLNGKTNINISSDGLSQHYRTMLYYSRYLKQVVNNVFTDHILSTPHWDLSIGEGADFISAMHIHGVGDPLVFLSVLVPERYMHFYFLFNAFFRIYLAGAFFLLLCIRGKWQDNNGTLFPSQLPQTPAPPV